MADKTRISAARSKQRTSAHDSVLRPEVFQPYVRYLGELLHSNPSEGAVTKRADLVAALDGQPGRELRKLYTIDRLRNTGTYFTGSRLASRLVTSFKSALPNAKQVVDPACGAGDLLVACARHLPLQSDLTNTLKDWGERLVGIDINSSFVDAARYRLALLALERIRAVAKVVPRELPLANLFPHIRAGSGMDDWQLSARPSLVVVNPPFVYDEAAKDCPWASGRVSQAALFIDHCIRNVAQGTQIFAILPDVLRTGTRYERWRRMVLEKTRIQSVKIAGQFDSLTEISVFLLALEVGKSAIMRNVTWARPSQSTTRAVKDLFDVRVGPVVPFRLDGRGSWFPYAHSEALPPWQTVRTLDQRIRFKGTTYEPPFVAIRRTSKADYRVRCIGTIVTGKKPIAVENHLLIAVPQDKKLGTCKKLLQLLNRDSSSSWMNERIRCRHLTVSSIGDLPWFED
jgi:hypothetical protein